MPNNMKSYKKIDEKAQTAKITVFAMMMRMEGMMNVMRRGLTNIIREEVPLPFEMEMWNCGGSCAGVAAPPKWDNGVN